jgi:uncharacterized LabA/DUF88 family protein
MNRTIFLIDGFNLYHSVKKAGKDLGGVTTKWLDIHSLCTAYLYLISKDARVEKIFYFSALAHHLTSSDPGKVTKHENYIKCLQVTGVKEELGRFKGKKIWCAACKTQLKRHEEKETDVAIASKLFEVLITDACDTVVLMTGDTDLAPAVKTAKALFPKKEIVFAFPYKRKNRELAKLSTTSFHIGKNNYVKHQFADPFILPNGKKIHKPSTW